MYTDGGERKRKKTFTKFLSQHRFAVLGPQDVARQQNVLFAHFFSLGIESTESRHDEPPRLFGQGEICMSNSCFSSLHHN